MDDFDEYVSSQTPIQEAGTFKMYRNTVGLSCPACDDQFDEMVVCTEEFTSLSLDLPLDLCVGRHEGAPVLFTHKH